MHGTSLFWNNLSPLSSVGGLTEHFVVYRKVNAHTILKNLYLYEEHFRYRVIALNSLEIIETNMDWPYTHRILTNTATLCGAH